MHLNSHSIEVLMEMVNTDHPGRTTAGGLSKSNTYFELSTKAQKNTTVMPKPQLVGDLHVFSQPSNQLTALKQRQVTVSFLRYNIASCDDLGSKP